MTVKRLAPDELSALTLLFGYNDEKAMIEKNSRAVENGEKAVFVICDGERPAGELHALLDGDGIIAERGKRAHLFDFRVRYECRGRGFGKRLLRDAIALLKADGYGEFTAGVDVRNARAKHIFSLSGFDEQISPEGDEGYMLLLKKGEK